MSPRVSIVLPIYNGEQTLQNTLDSLFAQTFQDFEIVACIDGSKDNSLNILKSYNDDRIKIIINKINLGLGRTMNRLVNYCHPESEYIAIAEQDDWYYPYRLEKQVEVLDTDEKIGMVSGVAEHYDGNKVTFTFPELLVKGEQYPRDHREMFLLNFREQIKVVNTCMMIRKSVHADNGLYFSQHYPNIPIDWQYVLRFSLVSYVHGIREPLVLFDKRTDRDSVTTKKKKMHRAARELIRNAYWEFENDISKKDYQYAMITQILLEGRQSSIITYFFRLIEALGRDPFDRRILKYLGNIGHRFKLRMK
ncbi:glycosyltransferase family 2 protein [Fulvivirgaceae bacterium BMA12]|uniref:Glycosyltransferase family 2 protein n=1 Tax=Agaribacillus aureus TaxID=3051825 RepID=A0ABT8L5E4_9BACT|nr:glycosyltransferase family 2 protein [Fulvivirgaceae bacterium BMA12]